jgi:4-amino-4-deoxy-L-arabinose transferase-like glycosyltransferase
MQGSRPIESKSKTPSASAGLLLILLLAIALRLPRLVESLWYDEIASYILYAAKGLWYVVSNYHDPSNHIFHSVLLWASVESVAWLGSIELAFRVPALIASLLLIVAMRALVHEAVSERAGWIAAILAAILPVCVLEGADARGYSMMMFFSAAASWALLRGLRHSKPAIWIAYAIFCALGVWSHLMTIFVPAGHGALLLALAARRETQRAASLGLGALLGAAALTMLLHAPALGDMIDFYLRNGAFRTTSEDQPSLLGVEGFHGLLQLGGSWSWWTALTGLMLLALGIVIAMREQRTRLALAATMLGSLIMAAVVAGAGAWVYARFALFAIPGAMLLIAIAIDWLWKKHRAVGVAALSAVAIVSAIDLVVRPPRQPLRDAVEFALRYSETPRHVLAVGLNVPDILVYEPQLTFTTHSARDFEQWLLDRSIDQAIVTYPHLLTETRIAALHEAGFERARTLPGWADWGRGEIWIYQRVR